MAKEPEINEEALQALLRDPAGPVGRFLEAKAYDVENAAKRLLLLPGSGRVYRRGGILHQASAPGEPPSSDTGRLLASVGHRLREDEQGLYAEIGTDVKYGLYLELGTRRMAPRPWLRPALDIGLKGG